MPNSSDDDFKGTVIVYTEVGNAQCAKARNLLHRENVPYTDVSLDTFPQCVQEVFERSGSESLPQIFFNSVHIGGVAELEKIMAEPSKWDDLLEMVRVELNIDGPQLPNPLTAMDFVHSDNANNNKSDDPLLWLPDEYSKLVSEMKKANLIKDNKVGLMKKYKNSFKGEELIDWLMKEKGMKRSEALEVGQEIIDRHVGQQTSNEVGMTFSPDRYYQLVEDDENKPLNASGSTTSTSTDPLMTIAEYNEKLVQILQPIYDDIAVENNRTILYQRLIDNDNFNRFQQFARELYRVEPSTGTPDERLAFFINIYNIMLIHITLKCGPPQTIWQRRKVMNATYYYIGGHKYALHSILNGILRGNRKGPSMLWKAFGKHDVRMPLVLPECEPLVHFALLTGTRSTPPIRVYNCKTIRAELKENAKEVLLNDEFMKLDTKKNVVHLLKTFKWYSDDFGGTPEKTIQWILEVLEDDESEKKKTLQKMFFTGDYSVEYLPYDWSPNGKERNEKPTAPAVDRRISTKKREEPKTTDEIPTNNNEKTIVNDFVKEGSLGVAY
ncbi:unnamed protein product [Caenorhabditis auriculariae]|uniref:DEP domain-containing protein n=1 Tax=Caenorhabditis auriculariae TaxID=2777116 RepID=A0A8S1H5N1_9PELO|nr:unnamed protein product [Caenorhabditis auriculariae]